MSHIGGIVINNQDFFRVVSAWTHQPIGEEEDTCSCPARVARGEAEGFTAASFLPVMPVDAIAARPFCCVEHSSRSP